MAPQSGNVMLFAPRFSITNAITAALTEIERARGFLEAASLSDEWIDSMRSRAFLSKRTTPRTSREHGLRSMRPANFWQAALFRGRTRTIPASFSTIATPSNSSAGTWTTAAQSPRDSSSKFTGAWLPESEVNPRHPAIIGACRTTLSIPLQARRSTRRLKHKTYSHSCASLSPG